MVQKRKPVITWTEEMRLELKAEAVAVRDRVFLVRGKASILRKRADPKDVARWEKLVELNKEYLAHCRQLRLERYAAARRESFARLESAGLKEGQTVELEGVHAYAVKGPIVVGRDGMVTVDRAEIRLEDVPRLHHVKLKPIPKARCVDEN